jgi:hypothetical protein
MIGCKTSSYHRSLFYKYAFYSYPPAKRKLSLNVFAKIYQNLHQRDSYLNCLNNITSAVYVKGFLPGRLLNSAHNC